MNDLTPYSSGDGKPPKSGVDEFTGGVLIPLASLVIAAVIFFSTSSNRPVWATVAVAVCIAFVVIWVMVKPIKNLVSKAFNHYGKWAFARKTSLQLREFVAELNNLLSRDRANTFPYLIPNLASKLSDKVRILVRLDRNAREFDVIQAWSLALRDRCVTSRTAGFWANAADFTSVVNKFSWACTHLREDVLLSKNVEEDTAKPLTELKPDWDAATAKILEFTSRVERFAKVVNDKHGTRLCPDAFQEVKPL